MRRTLTFIMLFIIIGCESDKKKLPPEFENAEIVLIEFLEKNVRIPSNYEKTSIEQMFNFFESFDNSNELIEHQYSLLTRLQLKNTKYEIFAEKNNYGNTISFMLGDYIVLNKSVLKTYVDLLENRIIPESAEFGFEYNIVESKFLKYNSTKIIKVKYEQLINEKKRFITQYLITYGLKTFTIVVANDKNIDFQYILKNFS